MDGWMDACMHDYDRQWQSRGVRVGACAIRPAYVWHRRMWVCVRARGGSGARRPAAGVDHEGAHHSPPSPPSSGLAYLSQLSSLCCAAQQGQASLHPAMISRRAPADPGRHPGPPVQSPPVKQQQAGHGRRQARQRHGRARSPRRGRAVAHADAVRTCACGAGARGQSARGR
jgi:hypothetical protein